MTTVKKIKQSPKLPPAERRRQLLNAAHRLFLRNGYRGTTVEDIAGAAGVTKGALYFHFKSKEDILLEMVKGFIGLHQAQIEEVLTSRVSLAEFFQVILSAHLECRKCDHTELVDIWVQAWRVPRIRRFIANRFRKSHKFYASRLDPDSIPGGASPYAAAVLVSALVHGLGTIRMVSPRMVDLSEQMALVDSLMALDQPRKQGRRLPKDSK